MPLTTVPGRFCYALLDEETAVKAMKFYRMADAESASCSPASAGPISIRTVEIDGAPWFVAKDVCRCLGLNNTTLALRPLAEDEKGFNRINTPGGPQSLYTLTESGLYKLVMRSDKPEARKFQDWVTRDVLPAIRKDGGYIMGVKGRLLGALRDSLQRPNHRRHQCSHAHAKGLQRLAYGLPDESLTTTTTL